MDVVVASQNPRKRAELVAILEGIAPRVRVVDATWPQVPETGLTFERNALAKAEAVHAATGLLAIADDSGLEVDALDGEPGVLSARYAGDEADDAANLALVLDRMRGETNRRARFRCVIALVGDGLHEAVEGVVGGTLRNSPSGEGGFGYDPIFEPDGLDRTFAEVTAEEKATLSHRGKALRRAAAILARAGSEGDAE